MTIMKTMKSYIWMAVATMMVATFGACSSEDLATNETPVQKGKIVTLTATLGPKDGSTTRALTDPGDGTLNSAWAVGEELEVMYEDTHSGTPSAKAKVTAVDGSGKATITVDLVDPQTGTAYFHYPYNRTTGLKDTKMDQIGTLNDLGANFDEFEGDGTITVTAGVPSIPDDVTLTRNVCVWKLKFTDGGSDITSNIISLSINDGIREYLVTPSSQDAIYVAMFGCNNANITIKAATATGVYSASKAGVTLQAGKSYHSTVALTATAASDTYRVFTSKTNYTDEAIPGGATTVTSSGSAVDWTAGTYVVSSDVTIDGNITLSGNVDLILKDGAELTVHGCIFGGADYDAGFTYSLSIYGQELGTGKLTVDYSGDHSLGVLTTYPLTLHGGVLTVGGSGVYQGIEPGRFIMYHGTVNATAKVTALQPMGGGMTMYGGNITVHSTDYGPAFLLPEGGSTLTISGGTVTAISDVSTGLEAVHSINISGGTINAQGPNGGINVSGASGTSLTISGGNITATSTNGHGINVVAYSANNSLLTITGGTITATGGDGSGAGISAENIAISGATTEIDATGGAMMEGILIDGGTGTISGGNITARGGENGVGLEGNITVNGGKVTAIGGNAPVVSEAAGRSAIDGSLTVNGGVVTATGGNGDGMGTDGPGISDGSTIALSGVTMYEGDSPNPATPAASQSACTKRYVIIK